MRDYPYHHLYAVLDALLTDEFRDEAFAKSEQGFEFLCPWVFGLIRKGVIDVDYHRVDFSNLHERVEIARTAPIRAKGRKDV